jgi:hypothetical protein
MTTRAIAAEVGVSVKQAWEDMQLALSESPKADVSEQRELSLQRLDHLRDVLVKKLDSLAVGATAIGPDGEEVEISGEVEKTTAALLRVEERRARLLGLDAPVKAEVEVHNVSIQVNGVDTDKL